MYTIFQESFSADAHEPCVTEDDFIQYLTDKKTVPKQFGMCKVCPVCLSHGIK